MTTHREEDYLEAILHIVKKKGYARVGDIAKHLECSAATVTEMFGRLGERGLVNYEKYGGVTLTENGRAVGEEIDGRHTLIKRFLEILGVPEGIADEDACEIEHSIHPETLERLKDFLDRFNEDPGSVPWLKRAPPDLEP
ncbi:MAG: metal-dependent transcriptional regulator [Candidatus Thermoplasmatota archaeon]|nr:metal-dependent transcriptional regulator [Candidatus Thermoplasmatota archaeon]